MTPRAAIRAGAAGSAAAFAALDAWGLLRGDGSHRLTSDALKLAFVALVALGVWTRRPAAGARDDARRLSAAFALVVGGDLAFLLGRYAVGLGLFLGVQLALAWRHGQGLGAHLRRGAWRAHRARLGRSALGAVALLAGAAALLGALAGRRVAPALVALGAIYAVALAASVGIAWLSPGLGALAPRRGVQAAAGMTLFFACDVTVAVGALAAGREAQVARALTWLFYAPALVLLALSGRRDR